MNKKLLASAGALTVVAVGGYLVYRWVSTKQLDLFLTDDTEDQDLDRDSYLERMRRVDEYLSDPLPEEAS